MEAYYSSSLHLPIVFGWIDDMRLGEVQLVPCQNNSLTNPAVRHSAGFDPPEGVTGSCTGAEKHKIARTNL